MRGPFHHPVALWLFLAVWPVFGVSGATILTSNNPDASLSARAQEDRRVELTVESTPSGAEVVLNGRARGLTPLRLSSLSPGISLIEVTAPGYETAQIRVRLQGSEAVTLSAPLRRETGALRLEVKPADAEVLVTGGPSAEPLRVTPEEGVLLRLPTGEYLLEVRRFGYGDTTVPVEIEAGGVKDLRVPLEAASFAVELQEAGDRGGLALSATAPGSALMVLRDAGGKEILRRRLLLETRETEILRENEVPPGSYLVTLRAEAAAGDTVYFLSRNISIPEGGTAFFGPWSGGPGLLYAPLPSPYPPGEPAVGTGWAYIPDPQGIDAPVSTFSLATSVGVTRGLGLFFGAKALLFETQERNRLSFTLGALRRLWENGGAGLALGGRATVDAALGSDKDFRPDFFGTPEGVSLFFPASFDFGPATVVAAPEAGFTWRGATWSPGDRDRLDTAGTFGARAGAGVLLGPLFVGASGRFSWSLGEHLGSREPTTQLGTEARLTIPQWGTAFSPFFALAGPWGDLAGIFGFSVTVGRY
jgi:hypothetical protein